MNQSNRRTGKAKPGPTQGPQRGPDDTAKLTADLEAALVRALGKAWEQINFSHFGSRLHRPSFLLHDGTEKLGLWNGNRRTLSIGRRLILDHPWAIVCEVLKHEMAHQFVDEVLGIEDQSAHGPAFVEVCRQRGIDHSARGLPAEVAAAAEDETILRRIARLLALAGSPNLNEAESAMREAQRLMLKHNLDATAATARRGFSFRHLGTPRPRIEAAEQILGGILAEHFFVEVIWVAAYAPLEGRQGRVLEVCGTPTNLEVAGWVHGYLLEAAERLWQEHKREARLQSDRERRRFRLGVMMGFREKLRKSAVAARSEGLVYKGDPALTDYLRVRHPRQTTGRSIGFTASGVFEHGRKAGRNLVLRRPIHTTATSRGLLLGPRSS
ncbi:MAG TPA: DUF2786 domain-containing protein [Polyangia bacterium]